jgi:hypothetical protein
VSKSQFSITTENLLIRHYEWYVYRQKSLQMNRFVLLLLMIFPTSLVAQKSNFGNWFIYVGNQKINTNWNWHNEVQYRNYNFAGDLEQLLLRTGIGYNLSENNNNLLIGYAFIHSEPYISGTNQKSEIDEHRIFQQFITRQKFGRFYLQHRYRLEERFINDVFRTRFRYLLSLNVPVNKPEMVKGAVYVSGYNEVFIRNRSPKFDRNRVYGAVGYNITKHIRAELGAMTQLLENTNRSQLQIVLLNNLPLSKEL